jgi:hypothetical protein
VKELERMKRACEAAGEAPFEALDGILKGDRGGSVSDFFRQRREEARRKSISWRERPVGKRPRRLERRSD